MHAIMKAEMPKMRFMVLSVVNTGEDGGLRGRVVGVVGNTDWSMVVSVTLSDRSADFSKM